MSVHMLRVDNNLTACDQPTNGRLLTMIPDNTTCRECIDYLDDGVNEISDSEFDEIIEARIANHERNMIAAEGLGYLP